MNMNERTTIAAISTAMIRHSRLQILSTGADMEKS